MSARESIHAIYEEQPENFDGTARVAVDALATFASTRRRLADALEQGRLSTDQERAALARLQADVLHS